MPTVIGIDLGTTTLAILAVDTETGKVLARSSQPNQSRWSSGESARGGRSEWDAEEIMQAACACARSLVEQLPDPAAVVGMGVTGQQHGMLLIGPDGTPLSPFINWQDRRGEERYPGSDRTFVQEAQRRLGSNAWERTGCRLAPGYLAVTLFWLKEMGILPGQARACFLMDYFVSWLTGEDVCTDPTCAASAGVLDLRAGSKASWDEQALHALGLDRTLFPEVKPSGSRAGLLRADWANHMGLRAGVPITVGLGDNQASFLGSVGWRSDTVLVNVGTGGQVAVFTKNLNFPDLSGSQDFATNELEIRPFPGEGFLLVSAGLCGGRSYAALEQFCRAVGTTVLGVEVNQPLYDALNRLAIQVPEGSEGVQCEPFFTGTRAHPEWRGTWSGIATDTFTPGHLARALLEGMAGAYQQALHKIRPHHHTGCTRLVGAGNGLRENAVLRQTVAQAFGLPLQLTQHREEAAFGAALLAACGTGVFEDLETASRLIRYQDE